MEYEDRVVCFLDILGFTELVQSTERPPGGNAAESATERLGRALLKIREVLDVERPEVRLVNTVTQFSDSVVLSFPAIEESGVFDALLSILWVQMNLVGSGMVCRGGVVRGKVIHTDKLLFGPAVIRAYDLERREAVNPRVIVERDVLEAAARAPLAGNKPEAELADILEFVAEDTDGHFYVDYITSAQSELDDPDAEYPLYLKKLWDITTAGLVHQKEEIRAKYVWLRDKLAPYLKEVKVGALRLEDPDLRDAYLSVPDL